MPSRRHHFRARLAALGLVVLASCALDEAELYRSGAAQVSADVGDLRVLAHHDDPAEDRWVDAVAPDPLVVEEGEPFREDDSRTAAPDEAAELRRLFTGVSPGRTLLVTVDCGACADGDGHGTDAEVHVWDLVVGEHDRSFSEGTSFARPGEAFAVEVGGLVTLVRPAGAGAASATELVDGDGQVRHLAAHEPGDGADLYVDVYLATAAGPVTISLRDATGVVGYPLRIG